MILDHHGKPIASTLPTPTIDPRKPVALTRRPTAESNQLAKKLVEARTQLDSVRIGVWCKLPNGERRRYMIAPAFIAEFCGMIQRQRLRYLRCFVEVRERIGEVFSSTWRREADMSRFADGDFKRILPTENQEIET